MAVTKTMASSIGTTTEILATEATTEIVASTNALGIPSNSHMKVRLLLARRAVVPTKEIPSLDCSSSACKADDIGGANGTSSKQA